MSLLLIRSKEGKHSRVSHRCVSAASHPPRRYRICRKGGGAVEWNVTGKYEIIEFVGEGSFGQVCRARFTAPAPPGSPETVVIKRISDVFQVRRARAMIAIINITTTIATMIPFSS